MIRPEQRVEGQPSRTIFTALIAVALLLAAIIINPFREMCTLDDSFAYARMVQHLLSTGHYQLDAWAAANIPVQIYLAAALSKIFGYSLSLLRCTTICLFAVGIAGFYRLLRELGHAKRTAAVLTLAIPATPLVLMLAFTFMSDVQFVAWLLLALLFYVRGIRDRNAIQMLLGSVAAGCAIGTRQFGIAILVGLAAVWLRPWRNRPAAKLLLFGVVVPLVVAIWQIYIGLSAPNLTQTLRFAETRELLTFPVSLLLKELAWRCAIIAQYAGISFVVLLPLVFGLPRSLWTSRMLRTPVWLLVLLACTALLVGLSMPSAITARPEARAHGLRTPLEMEWLLPTQLWNLPRVMWLLDILGIGGGAVLLLLLIRALRSVAKSRPETIFLAGTGIGLLSLHLVYRQLNDTYITALIPFALLLVAEALRGLPQPQSLMRACVAVAFLFILATAVWIRGEDAAQQALWNSADKLLRPGVQPLDIWAPCWADYHGSFDDWIAAGTPGYDLNHRTRYPDPLHDPYHLWLQSQWDHAPYRVLLSSSLSAPPGWQLIAARSYRAANLSQRYALSLVRVSQSPQPAAESSAPPQLR